MAVLRCHQDFLVAQDDAGLLRAYVTKYVYKFSDAAQNEWLNDDASATNMAATVLMRYKPYEPEVVLQMTGSRFRQWDMSTVSRGKRAFVVQLPDCEERPKELSMYMEAAWARGRIPLIDYLRKTTAKGKICNWLKKAHAASESALPLETFAANYAMQGEKVVAAEMLSRLNDRYYGQWMLLWVPFSDPSELWDEALLARVPAYHRYFAMCWTSRSRVAAQMWHSPANIASDMRLEAHTQHHIDTVSNLVAANGALVDDYLAGRLDAAEEERRRQERVVERAERGEDEIDDWNHAQQEYMDKLGAQIDRALDVQLNDDERVADDARRQCAEEGCVVALFGPPGTGKSTVAFHMVEYALEQGGRVLMALPTAQLASRMRERFGNRVEIDTCAAAFGFMDEESGGGVPMLSMYALIVVDEISQLEGWQSDKILWLWQHAERMPAVTMIGDKWQMAGFGDERPWQTRQWPRLTWKKELIEVYRCKDREYQKILNTLRTAMPDDLLAHLTEKVAWGLHPSVRQVQKVLHAHPQTTILTVSRRGAKNVNDCALQALYPHYPPRAVLEGDVESNPDNYSRGVQLFARRPEAARSAALHGVADLRRDAGLPDAQSQQGVRLRERHARGGPRLRRAVWRLESRDSYRVHHQRAPVDRHGHVQHGVLPRARRLRVHYHQIPGRGARPRGCVPRCNERARRRLHGHEPGAPRQGRDAGGRVGGRVFHARALVALSKDIDCATSVTGQASAVHPDM